MKWKKSSMKNNNNIVIRFMYYQPVEKYKGKKRDYTKERNFVSCNADFDYVKYVTSGAKPPTNYEMYIGNEEKCSGLFNENGYLNKSQTATLRKELRTTESNIWDMVVSFREDFGNEYCRDYDQAQSFLKAELPKFFKRIGLDKNNIVWYAGFHENTENKHIHISFFEKEPKHFQNNGKLVFSKGSVKTETLTLTKLSFENHLTSATNKLFALRKNATEKMKDVLTGDRLKEFVKKNLIKLYEQFPTTGRISYEGENMNNVRPKIISFVKDLLQKDSELNVAMQEFDSEYDTYSKRISSYKLEDKKVYKMDLNRRLGNFVIKYAVLVGKSHREIESQTKYNRKTKIYKKKMRDKEIDYCLKILDEIHKEEAVWNENFMARVNFLFEQEQWQNSYTRSHEKDFEM
ncbi:MAG: relaxase MobL [Clostridia bacterium]|nr:relaxase MobL [Clostridia bacterium]